MFNLRDIVRRDAATYYEDNGGSPVSRAKTVIAFVIFGVLVGAIVGKASNEFLAGALSAEAILVGFSFNVLFYLVANRLTKPAAYHGFEHELRFARLSKLSDEVFDNVTYFNVVAIGSAVAALALLLIGSHSFNTNLHKIAVLIERQTGITVVALGWTYCGAQALALGALISLLTESIYTFLRAVGRVRFYFSMLKTMNDDAVP